MAKAKKSKKTNSKLVALVAIVAVILVGVALIFVYQRNAIKANAEDIESALGCDRMTLEIRQTDIFCGNRGDDQAIDVSKHELIYKQNLTFEDFARYSYCDAYFSGETSEEEMGKEAASICQVYKQYQKYLEYFPKIQQEAKSSIREYKNNN